MDLPPFGESDDQAIAALLPAASKVIRNACRWHVWPVVTETLVLDGPGTDLLKLPTKRVSSITALSETQRGKGQSPVTVDVDDLEWSAAGLVWWHDRRCWTSRARGVSVTLAHGWAEYPEDLAQLAVGLASRSTANPLRLSQVAVGSRSESYGTGGGGVLYQDELAQLAPYRRIV